MFIQFGERRINLSLVKNYKPKEKNKSYSIEFLYLDGSTDEIHFFEKDDKMKEYLKNLDENFLKI